jgi:hypothetical protein
VITDEAVEMAREAYLSYKGTPVMHNARDAMRAALEAAAPHMQSAAWELGVEDGYHHRPNPYKENK